jgi:tetratricopeptide (TPR) repeat protein
MPSIPEALQIAVGHHQAGRLQQAAEIYQQILRAQPRHAQAMHLLGVAAHQMGQHDTAIRLISNAIRLVGNEPYFHIHLGEALRARGRLADAKACYRKAIELQPNVVEAYYNLALALYSERDFTQAIEMCRKAVELKPNYVAALNDLGNMVREQGQEDAAKDCYERAAAADPNYFDALVNLASLHRQRQNFDLAHSYLVRAHQVQPNRPDTPMYLGDLETARERWAEAIEWYQKSIALDPGSSRAIGRLATAMQGNGQIDAAIANYRRAIEMNPEVAETHFNLGTALEEQGHIEQAVAEYQLTLKYQSDYTAAHVNLGAYYQDLDEQQKALEHYDQALARRPDSAEAHYNRAMILLRGGDFTRGWPEYEWRYKLPKFPLQVREETFWDGSHMGDGYLLVHAEQGMGDTLQFIRYIPLIKDRCRNLMVRVHTPLVPLLRQSGFDVIPHEASPDRVDMQVPMLSLPGMLGTNHGNIPANIPYLVAGPEAVERWRQRLESLQGFRVGICWQGSRENKSDHARSIPLAMFKPLAEVPGVQLVSLQKRDGLDQLAALEEPMRIHELGDDFDEGGGAFMDTVGVMKNLDLVITADTSIAHLAGALGANTWVALNVRSDWRWMLQREDSPWYPTMRLFRQTKFGHWPDVFERIAAALQTAVGAKQV